MNPGAELKHARALTGNVVYNHFRHPCAYRVHMDLYGDRDERTAPTPVGRYFMERGNRHEASIFERLQATYGDDCRVIARDPELEHEADLERRARATLEAMHEGIRFILHGVLAAPDGSLEEHRPGAAPQVSDLRLRGETDLLERCDEPSPGFGAHSYRVGDVKSTRHAKFAQKMQVAFYSWILAIHQGCLPRDGYIVTGAEDREDFAIDDLIWTLRLFLEEEIHECRRPERVAPHFEPACAPCHWRAHCQSLARACDDLALVPGCRPTQKRALLAAGITSRRELLSADEAQLRDIGRHSGTRLDGFRDLKRAAFAQSMQRPLKRSGGGPVARLPRGSRSPEISAHRGPLLVVASIGDSWRGEEAALGTWLVRPEDLRADLEPDPASLEIHLAGRDDQPGEMLRRLYARVVATDRLLQTRREHALPVMASSGLARRLRQSAQQLAAGSAAAATFVEQVMADAVVLPRAIDRRLHLPATTRTPRELAVVLGLEAVIPTREDRPPWRPALEALAQDFGLDAQALFDDEVGLRVMAVRELREGGDPAWSSCLEEGVRLDLLCAIAVIKRLLRETAS
ncbi:MAG: TM0106 family RecB-like putative nuclease [Planctomycetes bacterium]|nr:TM0106 family RecB-like putative nuclease [Planctomycetota bacterium]